jgi:hypothetical protein
VPIMAAENLGRKIVGLHYTKVFESVALKGNNFAQKKSTKTENLAALLTKMG